MIAAAFNLLTGSARIWLLYAVISGLAAALGWAGWELMEARRTTMTLREELAAQRVLTAEAETMVALLDTKITRLALDAATDTAASAERAREVMRKPVQKPPTTNLTDINKWLSEPF